ncbi:MAG TPA: hypothetical protein VGN82_07185 [Bosea sp. (in: a-proteobacteria)]|jgi:hypothetical protein|uniref:hypothetical protein n=1 Tax=Bosea sp. (in: a-proteobacteria) TaxID=1871050 RepID=UPI002E14EBD9|nr:hypothetical protein [Bosea sp. (in: a-proteobacteria)]
MGFGRARGRTSQCGSRPFGILLGLVLAVFCLGSAAAFEAPPTVSAASILGAQASGPNYRVDPEVHSDGLLRLFVLRTAFGTFEIAGEGLMRERIRELSALRKLNEMSASDVFVKALERQATAPLRFGADLITSPAETLKRSASGVANMFSRIGTGITNNSASRDSIAGSVLGVDAARRALAVQLGVDPYTDFSPLSAKLNDIASASAMGGLSVRGMMLAIPGGAGVAISSTTTVDSIRSTLAERTSAQIVEQVVGMLVRAKVSRPLAERLVQNRSYTPTDLLVIAKALASLKVGGSALFVAKAAEATTREEAYFQRSRAVLLAANAKALGIGSFVQLGGFPLNRLKDGRLLALFPLDEIAWTEGVAGMFGKVASANGADGQAPVLATNGTLTPMAQAEITRAGWTVERLK